MQLVWPYITHLASFLRASAKIIPRKCCEYCMQFKQQKLKWISDRFQMNETLAQERFAKEKNFLVNSTKEFWQIWQRLAWLSNRQSKYQIFHVTAILHAKYFLTKREFVLVFMTLPKSFCWLSIKIWSN